jgi:very-short-patch-repair endonuclease
VCHEEKCDHHWEAELRSRVINKSGCPRCAGSKFEKQCERIMKELNIEFTRQKTFDACRHLRFDFFLVKQGILLELDGEQQNYDKNWTG